MTIDETPDDVIHAAPLILKSHQLPDRFYLGGARISAFRGEPGIGTRAPEDWIASTTALAGESSVGLTVLDDGVILRDAIAAEPIDWLGEEHVAEFGADTRLLVKLLNPEQRLPVHAHPDTEFAHRHLARSHGKAEAWSIIEGGEVFLGLKSAIASDDLLTLVRQQDAHELLGLLHRREVRAGDIVYVPAGTLHAIGGGILTAEVQEPEDLSILLEWKNFELDGARHGHLGLGFEAAVGAIDLDALSTADLDRLITTEHEGMTRLTGAGTDYFRLSRYRIDGERTLDEGFAVLIVEAGEFDLEWAAGQRLSARRGTTMVIPFSSGPATIMGSGVIIESRPPVPVVRRP